MATAPPGIKPMYVSNKQKEKYGLGEGITHKLFNRAEALEDAQSMGFYSLFHEIKPDLQSYPGSEVLIVADATAQYGENFYVCLTEAAKTSELQRLLGGGDTTTEAIGPEEAGDGREAAAEAARRAEEEAVLESLVIHEAPLLVKPYNSATGETTAQEVHDLTVRKSRPLLHVRIQRRRYAFGAACSFNERDSETAAAEFRSRKEPAYDLRRKELSVGLQACPSALAGRTDACTQTPFYTPVNSVIQCNMEEETMAMSANLPLASVLSSNTRSQETASIAVGTDADEELLAAATASGRVDPSVLRPLLAEAIASASMLDGGSAETAMSPLGMHGGRASMMMTPGARASMFSGGGNQGNKGPQTPIDRLVEFLSRALPTCEYALSQNETLNIFRNELTLLSDEDVVVMGNSDAKHIREERQFMDLELTNGKMLTSVEWHPKSATWLAVAAVPRLTAEQRILESATPRPSYILLYTLAEFTNQLVLECPADVTCMHWNPGNPNLLAIGTVTGHVAVFDMSEAHDMASKRHTSADPDELAAGENAGDEQAEGDEHSSGSGGKALHLKPKYVSAIEASGNRAVVGVRWLPLSYHLSGRNTFGQDRDGEICQFVSAGADGTIAVWDVKYKERSRTRRRASVSDGTVKEAAVLQSALVPGAAAANVPAPPAEVPWLPHYRVSVKFGAGLVNFTSFVLNEKMPSDPLVCGTEEGRIVVIDWAPSGESTGVDAWLRDGPTTSTEATASSPREEPSSKAPNHGSDEGESSSASMRVVWVAQDSERPPVAMQRSPFFSDVFLVVSAFSFSLWRRGLRSPVFLSSPSAAPLSTGRFSPTRAGVIYIGRTDGVLEVWDLLDSTVKPAVALTLMSVPATSMEFRVSGAPGSTQKQLLAVGDAKGSLHVLDIPLPLRKGAPNEESLVASYLDREVNRVGYYMNRAAYHDVEKSKRDAEVQRELAIKEAAAAKLDAEFQAALGQLLDKDPVAARTFDVATLQRQKAAQELIAQEEAYRALEKAIMAELGVSEDDILPLPSSMRGTRLSEDVGRGALEAVDLANTAPPSSSANKKVVSGSGAAAAKNLANATAAKSQPTAKAARSPTRVEEGKRPR